MVYISYTDVEMNIVIEGPTAIQTFLCYGDENEKKRLLFCLDRYLDPWFNYNLPYINEIFEILQIVITRTNSVDVKEEALRLLIDYAYAPFTILEKYNRYAEVESEIKEDLIYLLTN